jgi:hypothetical protein
VRADRADQLSQITWPRAEIGACRDDTEIECLEFGAQGPIGSNTLGEAGLAFADDVDHDPLLHLAAGPRRVAGNSDADVERYERLIGFPFAGEHGEAFAR